MGKSPQLKAFRKRARKIAARLANAPPVSLAQCHAFWRSPDERNAPEKYLGWPERSAYLLEVIKKFARKTSSILEIGCNCGRNLEALRAAGYANLAGIEINPRAVEVLERHFPELHKTANIVNAPAEDALEAFPVPFDLAFSMAVLMHIHPDAGIFAKIANAARHVLVIESEQRSDIYHFSYNYTEIFAALGMEQVFEERCPKDAGLGSFYVAKAFKQNGQ